MQDPLKQGLKHKIRDQFSSAGDNNSNARSTKTRIETQKRGAKTENTE